MDISIIRASNITPEYRNAVTYLLLALSSGQDVVELNDISEYVLGPAIYCKIYAAFTAKAIPSRYQWRWNQAKARINFSSDLFNICFFKLTPRRQNGYQGKLPTCKLWQFIVAPKDNSEPFRILFCPKEVPEVEISDTIDEPKISLPDIAFLAPFMDNQLLARDLWPELVKREERSCLFSLSVHSYVP